MGVPHADISLVANNAENWHGTERSSEAADDAGKGAGIGAAVEGVGRLVTGLNLMAIPGVASVVAVGWVAAIAVGTMSGAVVGGGAVGLVGSLAKSGVLEDHAHVYAEGVRRGGTVVTALVEEDRAREFQAILHGHQSVNLDVRGTAYRKTGWSSFDEKAPA